MDMHCRKVKRNGNSSNQLDGRPDSADSTSLSLVADPKDNIDGTRSASPTNIGTKITNDKKSNKQKIFLVSEVHQGHFIAAWKIFLENKYLKFNGLNLSIETLEGLLKHNGPVGDLDLVNELIGINKFKKMIDFKTFPSFRFPALSCICKVQESACLVGA